jgi:ABC-2 type transport system permease protein
MMAGLTYRAHFIFMAIGNIIYVVVSYFLWQAIYAAQPSMNGLSFSQAYLQIAISMGIFGLLQNWTDWFMSFQIQGGDVVRYLTKPVDYQLNIMFDALGGVAINFIGIALPTIAIGFALAGVPLPSVQALLLCLVALCIGFFINFCIDFLIGLLSFLTTSIWGISATKEIIVLFCSGAIIPLAFFPEAARAVLDWLPFQAIYTTPVTLLINPGLAWDQIGWLLLKQLGWVALLFGCTRLAFRASIRRIIVNGG